MVRERARLRVGFGTALREAREAAGLTQEQLAERAGVHYTYISLLERGVNSPSLDVLVAIADALGLEPHALLLAAERADPRSAP